MPAGEDSFHREVIPRAPSLMATQGGRPRQEEDEK